MNKLKILISSDAFCVHTGFANVAKAIADHLSKTHEVAYYSWFSNGWKRASEYMPLGYDCFSTIVTHEGCVCKHNKHLIEHLSKTGVLQRFEIDHNKKVVRSTLECKNVQAARIWGPDKYGIVSFPWVVDTFRPDIVLTVGDIWMIESYTRGPMRKHYKLISYMPVDGNPWPSSTRQSGPHHDFGGYEIGWTQTLSNIDTLVAYTEYGANVINERLGYQKCIDYIWHGTDRTLFYPIPEENRRKERVKFFQQVGVQLLDGTNAQVQVEDIVVTCTSRNQPRKGYPILFEAFAKFRTQVKEKAWLYCHAASKDFGWNLDDLAHRYDIKDAVIFNNNMNIGDGVPDKDMHLVYNISTFTVLPTRGEGFGYGIAESMACGIPVATTSYSGHGSPGGWAIGAYEDIKIKAMDTEPITGIDRAIADVDDCVRAMHAMLDKRNRQRLIKAGFKKAEQLDWKNILPQWNEIIDGTELSKYPYRSEKMDEADMPEERKELSVPCAWSEPPLVSIVVPSSIILNMKNYDSMLKQCITSLDQQTYINWELIIIDNVSYGQSMVDYLSKIKHRVVRWPFKYKPSKVLNLASSVTLGEYILFIHTDVLLPKETLMKMMNTMYLKPNIGILSPGTYDKERRSGNFGYIFDQNLQVSVQRKAPAGLSEVNGVSDHCMLIKASLFRELDGFDEDFSWNYHHFELCLRAADKGYKTVVDSGTECIHYGSVTNKYTEKSTEEIDLQTLDRKWGVKW